MSAFGCEREANVDFVGLEGTSKVTGVDFWDAYAITWTLALFKIDS